MQSPQYTHSSNLYAAGLCGNFDGDRKNDFMDRDGNVFKKVDDFNKHWQ